MSTFRAAVRVDGDLRHTERPLTAPEAVRDLIDSVVYDVTDKAGQSGVTSVELSIETGDEPIAADRLTDSSTTPLGPPPEDVPDSEDVETAPPAGAQQ